MVKKLIAFILTLLFMTSSICMLASCDAINNLANSGNANEDGGGETPTESSMYLGAGYNLITSAYYNQTDAKVTTPILNMEKLSSYVRVDPDSSNSNKSTTIVGESVKDYTKKISAAASVSGEVSFIKSFETNFSMSYDSTTNTNQVFVTFQNVLSRKRDYFYDCTTQNLASNVADSFKSAVESKTVEDLVYTYGTHVLTDVLLGGRYELNYLYEKTSDMSESDIQASANASSRLLSGSASASDSDSARELLENSTLKFLSYGGAGSDTTSFESAKNTYQNWLTSLDNTAKISLIDCTQTVPIWEIIAHMDIADAQEKSDAFKEYYDEVVAEYTSQMKPPVSISLNTKLLVQRIYVEAGNSATEAKSRLQGRGVSLSNILDLDLNKGASGDYIYLGWTTTTDPTKAVRGVYGAVFDPGDGGVGSFYVSGVEYIRTSVTDLNADTGDDDIFLYCSWDERAGAPVTDLAYLCEDETSQPLDGFMAVLAKIDGSYVALDVNHSAGGDDIFLYYKR